MPSPSFQDDDTELTLIEQLGLVEVPCARTSENSKECCPDTKWVIREVEVEIEVKGRLKTVLVKRKFLRPCGHLKLARDHTLTLDEWARMLLQAKPREYAEKTKLDRPAAEKTRKGRVARLARRRRLGLSLWNSKDEFHFPKAIITLDESGREILSYDHLKDSPGEPPCETIGIRKKTASE